MIHTRHFPVDTFYYFGPPKPALVLLQEEKDYQCIDCGFKGKTRSRKRLRCDRCAVLADQRSVARANLKKKRKLEQLKRTKGAVTHVRIK